MLGLDLRIVSQYKVTKSVVDLRSTCFMFFKSTF